MGSDSDKSERSEQLTDFVYGTNRLLGPGLAGLTASSGPEHPFHLPLVFVFLVCSFQQYSSTVYATRAIQARA